MANFVMCHDGKRSFYVNVDLVRILEQKQGFTAVEFDKGYVINVTEQAVYLATAAAGERRVL